MIDALDDPAFEAPLDGMDDVLPLAEPEDEEAEPAPLQEGELAELKQSLLKGASWHKPDHYFLLMDYASYMEAKLEAIRAAGDPVEFAKMCLNNIAGAGKFSSDRTIQEYWNELWRQ